MLLLEGKKKHTEKKTYSGNHFPYLFPPCDFFSHFVGHSTIFVFKFNHSHVAASDKCL